MDFETKPLNNRYAAAAIGRMLKLFSYFVFKGLNLLVCKVLFSAMFYQTIFQMHTFFRELQ